MEWASKPSHAIEVVSFIIMPFGVVNVFNNLADAWRIRICSFTESHYCSIHQVVRFSIYQEPATSVFRATHTGKTPRTDLMVLLHHVERAIGKVSTDTLNDALSAMLDHLDDTKHIDQRADWLALAERLPSESAGHAARLREILAAKQS